MFGQSFPEMRTKKNIPFNWSVLLVPLGIVLSMWVVFWLEIRFGMRFKHLGIFPGRIEGLWGVLAGPWIHSGLNHLSNNSLPMLFLLAALFYFYKPIALRVLLLGLLLTGLTTWLIGRPSWHVGASGLIYMLVSFIFFKGVQSRIYPLIAVALAVVFLYGGLFWYLFPLDPKISWEGHSAGFIVGILLALIYRKQQSHLYESYVWQNEDFDPEQDVFMRQFDEDGQFRPLQETEITDGVTKQAHCQKNSELSEPKAPKIIQVKYSYKKRKPQ